MESRDDLSLDSDHAADELAPVTDKLIEALETSTSHTCDVLEEQAARLGDDVREPYARAHMTRFFMKNELRRLAQEEGVEIIVRHIANTGIHVEYSHYSLKVLRPGRKGQVPEATTAARTYFYEQGYQPSLFDETTNEPPHRNLLYLWRTDSKGALSGLSLCYPVPLADKAWTRPLVLAPRGDQVDSADQPELEDNELPMKLKREQETDEQSSQR